MDPEQAKVKKAAAAKRWRTKYKAVIAAKKKAYKETNREHYTNLQRDRENRYWAKLRQDILNAYGRVCALCGETDEDKLTLDHVNHDGGEHRRRLGGPTHSYRVYRELRHKGFPREGFRILCGSCNAKDYWRWRRAQSS